MLLPRPAFNAGAVRIAGSISDDYIAVEQLSARLAFLPLLRGAVQFRELVLRRPEASVTRSDDGLIDFINQPSASGASTTSPSSGSGMPMDLQVDRVVVDNGTLVFQDAINGTSINVQGIDATVRAGAQQPVRVSADFTAGNVPLSVEATIGRVGNALPVSVNVKFSETDASVKFSGTLNTGDAWDLRGDLSIASSSSSAMLSALGFIKTGTLVPQALQKPLALNTKLRGTRASIVADPLTVDIGGTPGKGSIVWRADLPPRMDVKLEMGATPLESWRFAANAQPVNGFTLIPSAHAQDTTTPAMDVLFAPFKDMTTTFDIRLPALSYRGQTLHGGAFTASLSKGELTISQASLELPGASRLNVFGLARIDEPTSFEGALELETGDLRNMLSWLGFHTGTSLPGRLSNASLRAAVQGTPAQISLSDITATVDTSAMTGRVAWTTTVRPSWSGELNINALNLDAYLPLLNKSAQQGAAPAPASGPQNTYGVTPTAGGAFVGLGDFDADLHLRIDALTAGGVANGKVGLDVSLKDSALLMRSASFENVAGVTAWFSGGITTIATAPHFDNVQFDLSAADIIRLGRLFAFEVPQPLRSLTPLSLTGTINGGLAQADINATFKAAALNVHVEGQALTMDQDPHLVFNLDVSQPSYAALVKASALPWPLGTPDPGAVKITAHVTREKGQTTIENLTARVGDNTLTGAFTVARVNGRNEVSGKLSAVALAADRLWPKPSAPPPVSTPAREARVTAPSRPPAWSEEPYDWAWLKSWKGSVDVSGTSFSARGVQVRDFTTRLALADGAVEVTEWKGKLFGAPGQIYLRVAAVPQPLIQGEVAFIGGDLNAIATAVNGGTPTLKSGGKADFAGTFRASGASPAAMATDFSGSGTVKVAATETGTGVIAGLLSAVAAANQAEGVTKGSTVNLESRFSASEGRIKIEDATVASKSYGGAFTGFIDLGRWLVDLSGRLRLEARSDAARPTNVPISIKGALDLPNITLLPPNR